jgi:dienelactone hydrolase
VLTFDAACQGESEGMPRGLENPAQRVEDIKAALSFLATHPGIEATRIGVLGICASGGYVIPAAAGDRRIRAVATLAAVDVGRQIRVGADGTQDPAMLDSLLEGAAQARIRAARGEDIGLLPVFPASAEEARAGGRHVFEGWDYYCTPRGWHPRSAKALNWDSVDRMATFDAFRFIAMIAPRPADGHRRTRRHGLDDA